MEKTLCFIIDQKNIYLDKVLVELNFPLLFVCKDENAQYYMAMCIDAYHLIYLVAHCKASDISDVILGNITIRHLWESMDQCWKISTDDEMKNDRVEMICTDEIKDSELPEKGETYIVESDDIRKYALSLEDNQTFEMKIQIDFYVRMPDVGDLYLEYDKRNDESEAICRHYFTIREEKKSIKRETTIWENVIISPAA